MPILRRGTRYHAFEDGCSAWAKAAPLLPSPKPFQFPALIDNSVLKINAEDEVLSLLNEAVFASSIQILKILVL
jgi:hypothetical protein